MKLKSKQFKDFPNFFKLPKAKEKSHNQANDFRTTKSFNALSIIDKSMKTKASEDWKERSLSHKLGIKIPVYKLTEKPTGNKALEGNSTFHNKAPKPDPIRSSNSRKQSKRYKERKKMNLNASHSKPPLNCIDALVSLKNPQEQKCTRKIHKTEITPMLMPMSPISIYKTNDILPHPRLHKSSNFDKMITPSGKYSSQYSQKLKEEIKKSIQGRDLYDSHSKENFKGRILLEYQDSKTSLPTHDKAESLDVKGIRNFNPCQTKVEFHDGSDSKGQTKGLERKVLKSDVSASKIEIMLPQIGMICSPRENISENSPRNSSPNPTSRSKIAFQTHKMPHLSISNKKPKSPPINYPKIAQNPSQLAKFNIKKASKYLKRYVQNKSLTSKPPKIKEKTKIFKPVKVKNLSISKKQEAVEGWVVEENEFCADFG